MKQFSFILLLSIFWNGLFCQSNSNVLWGPDFKLSNKMSLGEILGHDSDQFYLLKYYGTRDNLEVQIESYNIETLQLSSSSPLALDFKKDDDFNIEVTWMVDDFIWVFTTQYNKRTDLVRCYSQRYSLNGKIIGNQSSIVRLYYPIHIITNYTHNKPCCI